MNNQKYYICITPFFPSPERWQGAYVLDQVKAIQRNSDYEVLVFKTCALNDEQKDYTINGIKVHVIRPLLMPSYILNGVTEGIIGHLFVHKLQKLGINLQQIVFVHCHTTNHAAFGFGVKRKNPNIKVLVQFHDLDPLTLRNGKWAEKRWNRRFRARKSISALNRADLLVCISEPVHDTLLAFPFPRKGEVYSSALQMLEMVSDMPSVHPKNMYILNNGVDTSIFHPQENNETNHCETGLMNSLTAKSNSQVFRIGCIANFQELKDHQTLVKAFHLLIKKGYTDIRLSLLGSGETRIDIEHYLRENALYDFVEWPKEVYHENLPGYYHSLDLFILPSYFEGFGCVCTEAAACGVPYMICTGQGAAECIPEEETHLWTFTPKDYEQLADRIDYYITHRPKQHLCKPFDIDILINKFLTYLKTL